MDDKFSRARVRVTGSFWRAAREARRNTSADAVMPRCFHLGMPDFTQLQALLLRPATGSTRWRCVERWICPTTSPRPMGHRLRLMRALGSATSWAGGKEVRGAKGWRHFRCYAGKP
jgi:hypothetical protein